MIFNRKKKKPSEVDPNYIGTGPRKAPPPMRISGKPPTDDKEGARADAQSNDGEPPESAMC